MTIINENTVVIFTSEELKTTLENDSGYNYTHLENNITLTPSIVTLSSTKEAKVVSKISIIIGVV